MLKNAENIAVGSIIFVRHTGFISWLIRKFLRFDYSHVCYYLGLGKILESDAGGVQINPLTLYLDNDRYVGEVVTNPLPPEKVAAMGTAMLEHLRDKYDYSLLFGNALNKLSLKCNRQFWGRLFDQSNSWICSELIAEGFRRVGVALPKPPAVTTPKDIYNLLQEGLKYER